MPKKFDLLKDEYLAIVDAFSENRARVKAITPGRMTVSREDLLQLLSKNLYEEPEAKLKLWRDLRWIIAEKGRLSCRYYDAISGKQGRGIIIDMGVHKTLKATCKEVVI